MTFPEDITKLGRGKAQKHILSALHGIQGGHQALELTALAQDFRGHFASLMRAGQALAKRDIISIALKDGQGYIYTLAPHTHA